MSGIRLDLLADLVNKNPKILNLAGMFRPPYRLEKFGVRNRDVRVVYQVVQKVEFRRCQMNLMSTSNDPPGNEINLDTVQMHLLMAP